MYSDIIKVLQRGDVKGTKHFTQRFRQGPVA